MPRPTQRPKLRLAGDRNQCPTCALGFDSVEAFDAHRVTVTPGASYQRRCMSEAEMRNNGMTVNPAGFWLPKPSKRRKPSKLRRGAP